MVNPVFTFSIKSNRDLIQVRQLARHAASLVGFDLGDQLRICGAVFELACRAYAFGGQAAVSIEVAGDCLHVICETLPSADLQCEAEQPPSWEFTKELPAELAVAREDLPWMLQQLAVHAPVNVLAEMRIINQELLALLATRPQQRSAAELRSAAKAA